MGDSFFSTYNNWLGSWQVCSPCPKGKGFVAVQEIIFIHSAFCPHKNKIFKSLYTFFLLETSLLQFHVDILNAIFWKRRFHNSASNPVYEPKHDSRNNINGKHSWHSFSATTKPSSRFSSCSCIHHSHLFLLVLLFRPYFTVYDSYLVRSIQRY